MLRLNHTQSSQISHDKVNRTLSARTSLLWAIGIIIWLSLIASTAIAGDVPGRKIETYKVSLEELSHTSEPRLDWRNPSYNVQFETPTSDWVEHIDFHIKVHAEGPVNRSAPIYIQFNDAEPVPVRSRGNSFEARLNLDITKVKAHRNTISIRYSNQNDCVSPTDGAYSIDMDDSLIVLRASTPSRPYYLRDIKEILASPMTAPKSIAINAHGADKLGYEALTAQGLALNMPSLPRFHLGSSLGDMQVYVGTRQELARVLRGTELANTSGPVIGVIRNSPLQLALTADNSEELKSLVREFSSRTLPPARRTYAFAGEFIWQSPTKMEYASVSGKTYLHELGNLRFDRGLGNSSQIVEFDVDNPLSAYGTAKINFNRSPKITKDSKVNVSLNGYDLGDVVLKSKRNAIKYDIPKGVLVGTKNRLIISPDLAPVEELDVCGSTDFPASVIIGSDSYINIQSDDAGFNGDLTRFAASGFPFSENDGANTNVVFSTKTTSDRASAIRIFAHLGKVYGSGWTDAKFYSLANLPSNLDTNTLFIGPHIDQNAPRGLANASQGRLSEPRIVQTASLDTSSLSLMSVRTTSVKGGIAAIYDNPDNNETLKAYITTSRGHNFTRAMDQILNVDRWNKLQGSMARWNGNTVEMTKTAFESEMVNPAVPEVVEKYEVPALSSLGLAWPDMSGFKVDMKPVFGRLSVAALNTRSMISNVVATLGQWLNGFFQGGKNILNGPVPNLGTDPSILPEPLPLPKPEPSSVPVVEITQPIVVASNAPKRSETPIQVMELNMAPQYIPGSSLRGLSKATTPQAEIGPVQYQPMSSLSGGVKSAYDDTSSWMGSFFNRFLGSPENGMESRKANLLIFAAAIVLLLLLLALARPHREQY